MKHYVRDSEIITVVERLLKQLNDNTASLESTFSTISTSAIGNVGDDAINKNNINQSTYIANKNVIDNSDETVISLLKTLCAEIGVRKLNEADPNAEEAPVTEFLQNLLYHQKERVPIPISVFASTDYTNNGLFLSQNNHSIIDYLKAIVAILGQPDISPFPTGASIASMIQTLVNYLVQNQWFATMTTKEYTVPSLPSGSVGTLILPPGLYKEIIVEQRTLGDSIFFQDTGGVVNFANSVRGLPNEKVRIAPFNCVSGLYALATGGAKTVAVTTIKL